MNCHKAQIFAEILGQVYHLELCFAFNNKYQEVSSPCAFPL